MHSSHGLLGAKINLDPDLPAQSALCVTLRHGCDATNMARTTSRRAAPTAPGDGFPAGGARLRNWPSADAAQGHPPAVHIGRCWHWFTRRRVVAGRAGCGLSGTAAQRPKAASYCPCADCCWPIYAGRCCLGGHGAR